MHIQTLLKRIQKTSSSQLLNHYNSSVSPSWCVKCVLLRQHSTTTPNTTKCLAATNSIELKRRSGNASDRKRTRRNQKKKTCANMDFEKEIPIISIPRSPIFPLPLLNKSMVVTDTFLVDVLKDLWAHGQSHAGAFLRKDSSLSQVVYDLSEIHHIGTFVEIVGLSTDAQEKQLQMIIKGHRRIRLTHAPSHVLRTSKLYKEPIRSVYYEHFDDECAPNKVTTEALCDIIRENIHDVITKKREYRDSMTSLLKVLKVLKDPTELADFGAALTTSDSKLLQAVMDERDVPSRLQVVQALLQKEIYILSQQENLRLEVEEKVQKRDGESNLQTLKKAIGNELGTSGLPEHETLIEYFRSRLESLVVPETIHTVIEKELNKLSSLNFNHSEYFVTRNYVDWLTSIPWGLTNEENSEISRAECVLNEDHFGLDDVKERVLELIAVRQLSSDTHGKIICLTGAPGVGKTSVGKSIARALDRKYYRFSVGGMASGVSEIKGHRRTYVGSMPGKLVQCLKKTKCENPLILIDEIDKIGRMSYLGDPAAALLEVLDAEQNSEFLDYFLDVPINLSKALFICTANTIDNVPRTLADRMEEIHVSGYADDEKICIAEKFLIPLVMKESGATNDMIDITHEAVQMLVKHYCRETGVRNLKKHIAKIIRKCVLKYAESECDTVVVVTGENLHEFVGSSVFNSETIYEGTPPGVCTSLAWTSMGGTTMFVETLFNNMQSAEKKEGSLETTGHLGDVMKESVHCAYTFAKSFFSRLNPGDMFFSTSAIHLHIPTGSTAKDVASAGCTIISALLSLALDKSVKTKLAMTGEVSLTGKILPVGGIKEKLLAAQRSDIRTVLLPEGNRMDYEDMPDCLKNNFDIVFIDKYDDVYKEIFDY